MYTETFWSKYHDWFVEMGYPELDIQKYEDGEWAIIQTFQRPIIPSMARFQVILRGLRNIEISRAFVKKYVEQIDLKKRFFWEREAQKSKEAEEGAEQKEKHAEELCEKATEAIMKNEDLMERIAENGIQEMDLSSIRRNIPKNKL